MRARRKSRDTTPTRSLARGAGHEVGVVFFVLLASALAGCGSKSDLVIGKDEFTLLRRDEFDTLDLDYWELATHTFGDNYAWFSPANASIQDGMLVLSVLKENTPVVPDPVGGQKPFSAAELRTKQAFLHGRFRARARLAPGVGIISSFFGFYDRYAMGTGVTADNQIVIECANTPEHRIHYAVVSADPAASPSTMKQTDFDPTEGFHVFGFDWTPEEVRFYVDDESPLIVQGASPEGLTQKQRLLMSAYPSAAPWVGAFNEAALPVVAAYDWVELYSYNGD
jgi:beta-glucanase (GH16 family)